MPFRWQKSAPLLLLVLFAIPVLINLDLMPVAWLDETMNLDPAVQWHLKGRFISALWPNQGSEQLFMCYLPLLEWLHMLNLQFVPWEMFWVRLPFLLLFVAGAWSFCLLLIRELKLNPAWCLLLTALLLFDKSIFELLRSVRSETLELSLMAIWLFLCFRRPANLFIPLLAGLLLMAHPKLWPAIGVGMLFQVPLVRGSFRLWLWPLLAVLPALGYFYWLDVPILAWWRQLQGQAAMHGAHGNRVFEHLVIRYWPYFKEQPWMPMMHLLTWWPALYLLRRHRFSVYAMPACMWMVQDLCWMLLLAPHHRYLPPHHLLMYLVWGLWLADGKHPFRPLYRYIVLAMLPLLLFPYISRMGLGFLQRAERNPEPVLRWLEREIGSPATGKTLVIGHSIAHYYLMRQRDTNLHFALEIYPQKFRFKDYRQVYYLGHRMLDAPGILYPLPASFMPMAETWSPTYRGIILTRVKSEAEMEAIVGPYRIPYP
jgi:hypothetical protein